MVQTVITPPFLNHFKKFKVCSNPKEHENLFTGQIFEILKIVGLATKKLKNCG